MDLSVGDKVKVIRLRGDVDNARIFQGLLGKVGTVVDFDEDPAFRAAFPRPGNRTSLTLHLFTDEVEVVHTDWWDIWAKEK